jgi:putative ABC transport system permease protein
LNAETYYNYLQVPPVWMNFVEGTMTIVLRTHIDPASMVAAARSEVQQLDKNQPVFNVKTVEEMLQSSVAKPRFRTLLLGVFAGIAMLLAATGLYGVIAYSVSQRINEIGVRIALGAQKSDVLKLIVGHGAQLAAIGVVIGLASAGVLMRIISKLLFGVNATDPVTFLAMSALLLTVALAASYIPARKAIKLNPIVALHHE